MFETTNWLLKSLYRSFCVVEHTPIPYVDYLVMSFKTQKTDRMNKSKCPVCKSRNTIKFGKRKGVQTYKCNHCGYRFRNHSFPDEYTLWEEYQSNKQTVSELAARYGVSESTVKRNLKNINKEWIQPPLTGGGYVHLDATYWGHNWGIMVGIEEQSGCVLYMEFIRSETNVDYEMAVASIKERGYEIKGLIIDGRQSLFRIFYSYRIQMCQFHMKEIIHRYLTNNPRLKAARELKSIMGKLTLLQKDEFERAYQKWKSDWNGTLTRRSKLKSGKTPFRHKRLRSAMHSIDFYLPYLFTFQDPLCEGMPNTNNKIEGTFTDLKKNLNNHSGMSLENRKRFICGFFLAWNKTISMKKQNPR